MSIIKSDNIPQAEYGIVGGSGTLSSDFPMNVRAEDVKVEVEQPVDIRYLFTTKTCPNCKLAKEYLKDVPYVTIDAEENMELATRYGVMQAPTLVVVNGDSQKKYVNASNIKKYVDQLRTALV